MQQAQPLEVGGSPDASTLEQGRGHDRADAVGKEWTPNDAARPRRLAQPDCDVDAAGAEIGRGMGRGKPHLDPGVGGVEGIEPRDQPAHHEGGEAGDHERPLPGPRSDLGRRCLQDLQGLAYVRQERCAGGGELDAPVEAAEQRRAEMVLQRLDLAADRTMGQVQLLRGRTDAQALGGELERGQGLERGQSAHGRLSPTI